VGGPSKSLTLEQAVALMGAARGRDWRRNVVLSLLSGLRTEEARALRWDHVVARSLGSGFGVGGRVRITSSWRCLCGGLIGLGVIRRRRGLAGRWRLARRCVEALREHRVRQAEDRLAAGPLWRDHGLVVRVGGGDADGRSQRAATVPGDYGGGRAGHGWVPRELRHTFVSLLSARGVPVEAIALLAGHNQTATTELVYRHQIVPALTPGR